MGIQKFSMKSVFFESKGKISEIKENPNQNHQSTSETCKGRGIDKGRFFWFLVLVALIYCLLFISSDKTIANNMLGDYPQYSILPPPSPREQIELKDVFFDFNKTNIKESAKAVLKENAEILRNNPDIIVFIQGYCELRENIDKNLGLKRANAVNEYIVKQGIEPHRVKSVDKCNRSYVSLTGDENAWRLDRMVHFISFSIKQKALDIALY
jgi:outer membrane protein OmpA-like peptidoglycan-associated protein